MKLYDKFGEGNPHFDDVLGIKSEVKQWALGALLLPGSDGTIHEQYIRYPGRTIVLASDEYIPEGHSPAKPYILLRYGSWEIINTTDTEILKLGYNSIVNRPNSFKLFVAVTEVVRAYDLLDDPEVAFAIRRWFLTYVATMAAAVTRSPIVTEVEGRQYALDYIGLDPTTGVIYAQQDGVWVTATGQVATGDIAARMETMRVGDLA